MKTNAFYSAKGHFPKFCRVLPKKFLLGTGAPVFNNLPIDKGCSPNNGPCKMVATLIDKGISSYARWQNVASRILNSAVRWKTLNLFSVLV